MKAYKIFYLLTISLMLFVSGCQEIDPVESLKPLDPADVDADAKDWSLILLTSTNQFASSVPTPAAVNSAGYLAELAAIKDVQSKLTHSQKETIEYWSGGGVLRWNQIIRKLVAQYALPPAPSDDGTYVCPRPRCARFCSSRTSVALAAGSSWVTKTRTSCPGG